MFDLDQTVEVADGVARLVDRGEVASERALDRRTETDVTKLAGRCARAIAGAGRPAPSRGVYDAMTTTVAIDDGKAVHTLIMSSGDDVPEEVGQLIDAVMRAPYEPTQEKGARPPS